MVTLVLPPRAQRRAGSLAEVGKQGVCERHAPAPRAALGRDRAGDLVPSSLDQDQPPLRVDVLEAKRLQLAAAQADGRSAARSRGGATVAGWLRGRPTLATTGLQNR